MDSYKRPIKLNTYKDMENMVKSDNYKDKIYDIVVNTFEVTCYMFPLEEWEAADEKERNFFEKGIRSVVGFNGAATGKMIIEPSSGEFLTAMAANMLGIEAPDAEEKSGALCEVANIICGNTVPLFAHDDQICYIEPPSVLQETENMDGDIDAMKKESVHVYLDEGAVRITVYYTMEEEL
ncbi:Chemotaxis phosphatase CheX [Fodinibius roseus]|uniref:Chemotaxis phosphatase CheX n=1 Tax=Fodinibius roseus TaxID=1194090 RepID=A0A1M5HHQ8_9BACT|nr:chemotaxis protein CheX [Fodinibius roseus]SHG15461.1 Chemotaxis phosphatase CheX [Fodinibius roseus]